MKLKFKALLAGLSTYIPGYRFIRPTGGTDSARYCYSIWLRHLVLASSERNLARTPRTVAELGPGDSIGIGLAALLSGADKYYALDIFRYTDLRKNLAIFDELVELFAKQAPIPGDDEFPLANPKIDDYTFPKHLLNDAWRQRALTSARIAEIRACIEGADSGNDMIVYYAPWNDQDVVREDSIDMIYSQAVLEHVDDLTNVYENMRRWLKPDGFMSHQIDFKSHGKADTWNGHWTYSDAAWRVVVGRQPYLLNREPRSTHLRHLESNGFQLLTEKTITAESVLERRNLARRFRDLSNEDLTTSGSYMLSITQSQDAQLSG